MIYYIVKRLLSLIPILFIVSLVVFFIIHLTPGDPVTVMLGDDATATEIAEAREEMGLNAPIYEQYFNWILGVFQGDLGNSYFMKESVLTAILEHLVPTLSLAVLAIIISIVVAIPSGIAAARRQGSTLDQSIMGGALMGMAIPSFLLGLILILIFAVNLKWFPATGYASMSEGIGQHLKYLILPAIGLGAMQTALITRMTRSSMLEVLNTDFIKTSRAKGVKNTKLIYVHALRNAFLPILTVIGQSFGTLVAGAIVIETIFNIPGIGQLVINSVERRDYAVIQGVVLFITVFYVFINLVVDLLYGIIDPRVRLEQK